MLAKNQIRKKKHLFNKKERDEFFGKNGTFSYRVDDSKVSVVPNIFLLQNIQYLPAFRLNANVKTYV